MLLQETQGGVRIESIEQSEGLEFRAFVFVVFEDQVTSRKDPGAIELCAKREEVTVTDDGQPTATWEIDNCLSNVTATFYPPFSHVDRQADYRPGWEPFQRQA